MSMSLAQDVFLFWNHVRAVRSKSHAAKSRSSFRAQQAVANPATNGPFTRPSNRANGQPAVVLALRVHTDKIY